METNQLSSENRERGQKAVTITTIVYFLSVPLWLIAVAMAALILNPNADDFAAIGLFGLPWYMVCTFTSWWILRYDEAPLSPGHLRARQWLLWLNVGALLLMIFLAGFVVIEEQR